MAVTKREKTGKSTKSQPVAKPRTRRAKTSVVAVERAAKRVTKKAQLINHLDVQAGITVAELSDALGWLPHTTRAALTGLRKAGYIIEATKSAEIRASSYRIIQHPARSAE